VIRPEPEPTTNTSQCLTAPCWYAGKTGIEPHWGNLPKQVKWIEEPHQIRTPAAWEDLRCIGVTTNVDASLNCDDPKVHDGIDHYDRVTLEFEDHSKLLIKRGFRPNFYYSENPVHHELDTVWWRDRAVWPPALRKKIIGATGIKVGDTAVTPIPLPAGVQFRMY
jgi:hypothetical protein